MSTALSLRISDAVKAAMRAREKTRLGTLRLLQAAIKQKAVDERIDPDDAAIVTIIEKQVKQRRESIAAYESAGRADHAAQERAELEILQEFLPRAADAEEIEAALDAAIAEATNSGLQGGAVMGAVMRQLKARLAGRADMAALAGKVRQRLAS